MKSDAGKGSKYRPVDWEKYSKNYDDIFKKIPDAEKLNKSEESTAQDHNNTDKK